MPNRCTDPPPDKPFPAFTYNETAWTAAGYTNIRVFGPDRSTPCTDARNYLQGTGAGTYGAQSAPTVIRVTGTCSSPLTITSQVTVRNDLAILNDGPVSSQLGISFNSNTGLVSDNSKPIHNVFVFAAASRGLGDVTSNCNFAMSSNAHFRGGLRAVVRTPCAASFPSNVNILDGQIFARSVSISSNSTMTYYSLDVPGAPISGFHQDIVYTREIPN